MRGSAQRAIELAEPFHRYHFIDKSRQSLGQLQAREKLDRFLGDKDWRERWYRRKEEEGLFGLVESVEKVACLAQNSIAQLRWATLTHRANSTMRSAIVSFASALPSSFSSLHTSSKAIGSKNRGMHCGASDVATCMPLRAIPNDSSPFIGIFLCRPMLPISIVGAVE
jgi:hypothetical protein